MNPLPPRVLIAADAADLVELLAARVRLWGLEPVVAHDGPAALAAALACRPALALVGLDLPVLDGFVVARELRRQGPPRPLLAALPGSGEAHLCDHACEAGFDFWFPSPVDLDRLDRLLAPAGASSLRKRPRPREARGVDGLTRRPEDGLEDYARRLRAAREEWPLPSKEQELDQLLLAVEYQLRWGRADALPP